MGYIRKKGPGKFQATADLGRDPLTGRRMRRSKNHPTEREARRWIREQEGQVDQGLVLDSTRITVAAFLESWLVAYVANHAPTTARNVSLHVKRHIVPGIGHIRLRDLTPQILMAFYATLPGATVPHGVHVTCHHFLKDAHRAGLIPRNPAEMAVPPKLPAPTTPVWWSAEELSAFLVAVESDPWFAMWRTMAMTGIRKGEALGLEWPELDLARAKLTVLRNVGPFGAGPPKTPASRRTIDLDAETVNILHEHWKRQRAHEKAAGPVWAQASQIVFSSLDGRHLPTSYVSDRFRDLLKKHGLRTIKLHELRDTHGSLLVKNGVHLKVVQERLGHSSPKITLERYAHIMPSMGREAAELAGMLVEKPAPTEADSSRPASRPNA